MALDLLALFASATLFGGMMLYSFGFAAFVFTALPPDDAGKLIRRAFPWYYLFVIVAAAIGALAFLAVDAAASGMLTATAISTVYAREVLMPRINAARDAGDKARFGRLHGLSVAINFVQLGLIGWAMARLLTV